MFRTKTLVDNQTIAAAASQTSERLKVGDKSYHSLFLKIDNIIGGAPSLQVDLLVAESETAELAVPQSGVTTIFSGITTTTRVANGVTPIYCGYVAYKITCSGAGSCEYTLVGISGPLSVE